MPRPHLTDRLERGTRSKLTLVSAPAGFGKSTLIAEWLDLGGCRIGHGVALARCRRQPARRILDARDRRAADGGPRRRREGADTPRIVRPVDRGRPGSVAQRPQRAARRPRAGPRRLPRDRRGRDPGRHGVPARASAGPGSPGDRHARRSGAAPGSPPRARRPGRGPRGRSALHGRRSRCAPQRGHDARADGPGCRSPGGPDRRLDRRHPAGRALDAGARRHRRLHQALCRRRPLHRRLPRRRGPRAPVGTGSHVPAGNLDPQPAQWLTDRCRHRSGGWQGDAGGARATEPAPRPPGRPPGVVPLPPPVRRRAPGAPAR